MGLFFAAHGVGHTVPGIEPPGSQRHIATAFDFLDLAAGFIFDRLVDKAHGINVFDFGSGPQYIPRVAHRDIHVTADPAECVADKGYHSRAVLRALNDSPWKTRIAAPKQTGFSRWHGDEAARRAVTNNRARLKSGVAREAFKLRAEIVERCFAHNLDRGGMRRTWLRGRGNVHKRYLLHVAGHNLSLLMRQLIGAGTPREAVAGGYGGIFVLLTPTGAMLVARGVSQSGQTAFAAAFLIWE